MPTLLELKERYRQSVHPTNPPKQASASDSDEIAVLLQTRDQLNARLDKGYEFLNDLAHRVGQDSPEFDRYLAEWLRIKEEFEAVCDEIVVLEAKQELAAWLETLPPPGRRRVEDEEEEIAP